MLACQPEEDQGLGLLRAPVGWVEDALMATLMSARKALSNLLVSAEGVLLALLALAHWQGVFWQGG